MASMYERNGWWYCKFYEAGQRRRVSLKTQSKQRARAKVVEIEAALEAEKPVDHRADSDIDTFTKAYLKRIEGTRRPHTVKTITLRWRLFLEWANPIRLSDVTTEVIEAYRDHLLAKGQAKTTVTTSLAYLKSIFSTAMKMRAFDGPNPVKGVDFPKLDEVFPRYLELNEIDTLLDAAKAHSRDMYFVIALGVYCGLRKNEILGARWSWIDFKGSGRVLVQPAGNFKTKSGKSRKIPLSAKLRPILEEHKGAPDEFIVYPNDAEKNGDGTKYRTDFRQTMDRVAERVGLDWVTMHKLRHTFASQHAIGNVSIYKIKTWLGHANISTTEIYAHLSPDDDDINTF